MTIKVSVICSVYNNEKYIHQCVNSILQQSLKEIEIILIDNGCSDNCPEIIDAYAKKDPRIIVIHNPRGSTFGYALNQGIKIASGEYIGIVESDDFIETNMFEELYNQAKKYKAEICLSDFYIHEKNHPHLRIFGETIKNTYDNKIFNIDDFPFLLTCHQSMWSKLYKKDFLQQFTFINKSKYIDAPFMVEVLIKAKRLIAVHKALYNYRIDNPNASNSNKKNDISLTEIIDCWEIVKKILKKENLYQKYKEEFWYAAAKPSIRFYRNIDKKFKKLFFKKFKKFLVDLKKDNTFSYKYFEPDRKEFFINILKNEYKSTIYNKYEYKSFIGIPIYEQIIDNNIKKQKYFCGLIQKTKEELYNQQKINYKIFNIKIYSKKNHKDTTSNILDITNKIQNLTIKINDISRQILSTKTAIQAAAIHPNIFTKYKNIFYEKEVVICGCGPSISNYKVFKDKIHIGINRAYKKEDIKFDFLFVQDCFPEGMDEINNYRKNNCTKFYGILPFWRKKEVSKDIKPISEHDVKESQALKYIIDDQIKGPWAIDLAIEPIADYMGCVFSALQFTLYCHPSKIYLVGFDANNSEHFYNKQKQDFNYQQASWKYFKEISSIYYPDIKIISINPVGLAGIFEDIYIN